MIAVGVLVALAVGATCFGALSTELRWRRRRRQFRPDFSHLPCFEVAETISFGEPAKFGQDGRLYRAASLLPMSPVGSRLIEPGDA